MRKVFFFSILFLLLVNCKRGDRLQVDQGKEVVVLTAGQIHNNLLDELAKRGPLSSLTQKEALI